ncbi:MAG: hypothetical protein RL684_1525 [Pseudomonadota bacterium]|jgi:hypothetical protein
MKANVGSIDKLLRIVVGLALIAWGLWGEGAWHRLGFIGIVPILTALVGFCPLYTLLGIRTNPSPKG